VGVCPPGCIFPAPRNGKRLSKHFRRRWGNPQNSQEKVLGIDERTAHAPGFHARYKDHLPAGDEVAFEHGMFIVLRVVRPLRELLGYCFREE